MQFDEDLELKDRRVDERHSGPIGDLDGNHRGRIVFYRDITKRKLDEAALREGEERLRLCSRRDSSAPGNGTLSQTKSRGSPNTKRCNLWSKAPLPELMTNSSAASIRRTGHSSAPRSPRRNRVSDLNVEYRRFRNDGSLWWVETRGKFFRDEAGSPTRLLGLARDISEKKQAEDDLRYRDEILHAVMIGAAEIMTAASLDAAMPKVLETVGSAVRVDRVVVMEVRSRMGEQGGPYPGRRHGGAIGGDAFAILESDLENPSDAAILAGELLEAIGKPLSIAANEVQTSAGIGIAIHGEEVPDPETLLSHADVALYRAKSEGRSTFRFFTEAMDREVRSEVTLLGELPPPSSRTSFSCSINLRSKSKPDD